MTQTLASTRIITRPTMLLDRQRVLRNVERMATKARLSGVALRPHFKTHQAPGVGEWFRDLGVTAITVSSVDMAEVFAACGWRDITIAFPANVRQVEQIDALAREIRLGLLVDSLETLDALTRALTRPVRAWIEIDADYGRSGLRGDDTAAIVSVAAAIADAPLLDLAGILTHAGQTYHAPSADAVRAIYAETASKMQRVADQLRTQGFGPVAVSVGDTPGCSLVEDLGGVDEVRPGNFVLYDAQQLRIGSCSEQDIALAVACPVVARYEYRNELVIYGGAVHLSRDTVKDSNGRSSFGYVARVTDSGWGPLIPGAVVSRVSQEHGVVSMPTEDLRAAAVGDLLAVIPAHSCLTVNLMREFRTLEGDLSPATAGA